MFKLNLQSIVLAGAWCGVCGNALATAGYQVTFDLTTDLQNVFIYADEFNGDVYAWDLFPAALGTVSAGTSTFQLGDHNLMAWAILATHSPSGVATGINDAGNLPHGVPFELVFPGYTESTVESNLATLYVGGAYNTPQAFFLTEFVLAVEDTLKTDFPTGSLHMYTFSNGVNVGTATFSIVVPPVPGDLNCDGVVSFGDINPFVLALSNPAVFAQQYPNCNILNGDINGDGTVSFADINPFVSCLTTGHCP
jgi:hypothetical protein